MEGGGGGGEDEWELLPAATGSVAKRRTRTAVAGDGLRAAASIAIDKEGCTPRTANDRARDQFKASTLPDK